MQEYKSKIYENKVLKKISGVKQEEGLHRNRFLRLLGQRNNERYNELDTHITSMRILVVTIPP
jgi:hypothetical protein